MAYKIKNNRGKILFDIDEKLDTTYFGYPTNEHTIGVDIDDDITAHIDVRKKEIIGFTITHWNRFKKKVYLKEKAKESIKTINDYILKHYPRISIPTPLLTSRKYI